MPTPRKRALAPRSIAPRSVGVIVLRATIRDVTPPVWREISVPDTYSLAQLHRVLQCTFAWMDYHLHEFRLGRQRFVPAVSELPGKDTARTSLASLKLKPGAMMVYEYDYGDGWEHELLVVAVVRETTTPGALLMPRVLAGERAAPPDDSGGAHGYVAMLAALADPKHPEHPQAREWIPPGFDPAVFDLPSADHAVVLACAWGAI